MGRDHPIAVISIGGAVQDVFLEGKIFKPQHEKGGDVEEFRLGTKSEVEKVTFSTGGGATNAAATFARQGLQSFYFGKLGRDVAGKAVLEELHEEGINTSLVTYSKEYATGYSVLLLAPNGERTILTYRGASVHYTLRAHDLAHAPADWLYISSLEGNFEVLETALKYAKAHDLKVAINPGKKELAEKSKLKALLEYVTVLSLNKEEAKMLFAGDTTEELITILAKHVPYAVITDGPRGSMATDGKKLYQAGMYKDVKVIDRTGAGDAFSSGFVAMVANGERMEHALTFASANSTSVVQQVGAKAGILPAHTRLKPMSVEVSGLD